MPQVTDFPILTKLVSGDTFYAIRSSDGLSSQITVGDADQSLSKNKIVNVNSVNELVNLDVSSIPNNSRVYVKSYYDDYSDNGLGGGHFYWKLGSSATEDSGRYFKPLNNPSAGRWERLLNGNMPNIRMFGAKAGWNLLDGRLIPSSAYDCTSGIQNALNACDFNWSQQLYFPAGNYKITNTLLWNAGQTNIIGDGCNNSTCVWMDTGIEKDMVITNSYKTLLEHNNNPSESYVVTHYNDLPRMSKIAFQYAGGYHRDFPPIQNSTNYILTLMTPGETNQIDEVYMEGGKAGIRIIGPGAPGLRLSNSTINGQGECGISLEGVVYKINGPAWTWTTGVGAGVLTVDNCSTDYRGANITGFSFIKSHKGAYPQINIKDLKVEGLYPSGIVNYERSSDLDSKYGSISIDGLFWIQTESDENVEMTVVSLTPQNNNVQNSIDTYIKNITTFDIDYIIKDYILKDDFGLPYITYPTNGRNGGLNQTQFVGEPISYFGKVNKNGIVGRYITRNSLNRISNDDVLTSFEPMATGWHRIAEGGKSLSSLLNNNFTISNSYEIHNLETYSNTPNSFIELKSKSAYLNSTFSDKIVTKARLYYSDAPLSGTSQYPLFLDIFINNIGYKSIFPSNYEGKMINVSFQKNNSSQDALSSNIVAPFLLTGFYNNIQYGSTFTRYAEVDLTKPHDKFSYSHVSSKPLGAILIEKDLYLFANSERDVRTFDAGSKVIFSGGGYSTQAQGFPIFTNGKLTNIVMTESGNGYTSSPTILIIPNTTSNGTGAFASGQIVSTKGISRIHIISGGDSYGFGPQTETAGYSLTGVQDGSVLTSKILDSAVTTSKIADLNITTAKIADTNITYAKIANSAVSGTNIADNGISTSKIINRAITAEKIDVTGLSRLITSDSVSSSVRRLIIQNNPSALTTQVLITADEIVLKNNSGQSYLANSPVINLTIPTNLDNGSELPSTWYGIWGIYNSGSNLVTGVLSRADGRNFNYQGTSSSDATYGFGPLMPANYSYKALLGHVYNNSASNFDIFLTQDRRTYINDTVLFSSKSPNAQNTYQFYQTGLGTNSINLTGLIPKNSIKLCGNIGGNDGYGLIAIAATSGGLGANVSMSYYGGGGYISTTGSVATWVAASSYEIPLTGQGFWWKGTFGDLGARNVISVNGYEI